MARGSVSRDSRLAWIFGSSRSGSTWLLQMLSDLNGVVPIDDPHLGHHLGVWRPIPLAWAACDEPPELTTLLDVKAEEPGYFFADGHRDAWWEPLRELIWARFEAQTAESTAVNHPAPVFVVKEPGSHVAPLLAELFPASKLVFLLRDGRDVVDSWLDAYSDGSWAIPGGAFPVAPEGRPALIRWLSAVWAYRSRAVRTAFESHPPKDRILIRYEELRSDSEQCLERVCSVLGLDPERVPEVVARHRFERVPSAARGPRRAVRQARPGGWRENLTLKEQAAMHEALGSALSEFGYGEEPAEVLAASG
jgi:Sulfotransferase family